MPSSTPIESTESSSDQHELAGSLDESLRVPISTQSSADDDSSASESDESFSNSDAQQVYKQWLKGKSKEDIKMMGVMFMDSLIDRFNMTTCGAAIEVGLLLDCNEKTTRTWRKDFYANHGHFSESKQGKHLRNFILDDESLRHKAAEWVRQNATAKGKPNMTFKNISHIGVFSEMLSDLFHQKFYVYITKLLSTFVMPLYELLHQL